MRSLHVLSIVVLVFSCATPPTQHRAGVLDYLYPVGKTASPPTDIELVPPLRVGIAFAPESGPEARSFALDESRKRQLLERIVAAFKDVEEVEKIEIVPASYLKAGGGFENVDQIKNLLGIDLIALLSYEQTQFGEFNKSSLAYWTLVGAYFVEGNKNETHTFIDTSVLDIPSRALLFNAAGRSEVENSSTALEVFDAQREDSAKGYERAVDAMIVDLQRSLDAFREQARTGTVRGAGTPALAIDRGPGSTAGGGTGAGAVGALECAFALAFAGASLVRRRPAA
jgi:rhombotail lipoprotein